MKALSNLRLYSKRAWSFLFPSGPYLNNPFRLADILAAIQVLGSYEFAARDIEKWANRLGRTPRSAATLEAVFLSHPELFTKHDTGKFALVWRRSFQRDYDTETSLRITNRKELEVLKKAEKESDGTARISREPLNQSQIEHLCNLAVNLHEREIQHRQEMRWWITVSVGIVIAIVAA